MRKTIAVLALAAASTIGLSACSMTPTLDQEQVEEQISTQLQEQVGRAPEEVTCPGDLEGEVGTTMVCQLSDSGQTLDVTVTVTSVEGSTVNFDIAVADA